MDKFKLSDKPPLLIAKDGVSIKEESSWNTKDIVSKSSSIFAVSVDYHWQNKFIYYSGVPDGVLYRVKLRDDGGFTPKETIIATSLFDFYQYAVDWVHDKIFWIDLQKNDTLYVSNLDGTMAKTLAVLDINSIKKPVLDPYKKYIYFTSSNGIERIGMNGRDRKVIYSDVYFTATDVGSDIAIDLQTDRIYYKEQLYARISSMKSDGSDNRQELTNVYNSKSLTCYQGNLYYLGKKYSLDTFIRYNPSTGTTTEQDLGQIFWDYKIYHPFAQISGTNPCDSNNGGCTHLCLPNPTGEPAYTCECPDKYIEQGNSCVEST
ncbi:very low-density lipoprotein receptor-like isoform X4 [Mytilus californianus]|uniref:very low-density lipoprotein receptor-like isoform X4 n=1 Tax=Mytilus californianus TaxID=6549 RepID=UPI0022486CC1|nr:very low-density lipoprotein receptor-like isoform X4 [Mytilus californianus]